MCIRDSIKAFTVTHACPNTNNVHISKLADYSYSHTRASEHTHGIYKERHMVDVVKLKIQQNSVGKTVRLLIKSTPTTNSLRCSLVLAS